MYRAGRETPWDQERSLLIQLLEESDDDATKTAIEERLGEIDNSQAHNIRGMQDAVFLPKLNTASLALRPGFVFLDFDYEEGHVSQAEVYFTVATVLHHLRHRDLQRQSLAQHIHVRRVISPRCFERFNDGVIQAAILRAAIGPELDYSLSDELSMQMERILDFVLSNGGNESGEAAREFVLAIAVGKLRIYKEGLDRLKDKHAAAASDPILAALWTAVTVE